MIFGDPESFTRCEMIPQGCDILKISKKDNFWKTSDFKILSKHENRALSWVTRSCAMKLSEIGDEI